VPVLLKANRKANMSKSKRQLSNEQKLHAVTRGAGEPDSPLPETIVLSRSQSLSITALANDEARLTKQAQEIHAAIQATQAARQEVLEEIAAGAGIESAAIAANYQFDGKQLVRPLAQS
jgi:hypothetical protein